MIGSLYRFQKGKPFQLPLLSGIQLPVPRKVFHGFLHPVQTVGVDCQMFHHHLPAAVPALLPVLGAGQAGISIIPSGFRFHQDLQFRRFIQQILDVVHGNADLFRDFSIGQRFFIRRCQNLLHQMAFGKVKNFCTDHAAVPAQADTHRCDPFHFSGFHFFFPLSHFLPSVMEPPFYCTRRDLQPVCNLLHRQAADIVQYDHIPVQLCQ